MAERATLSSVPFQITGQMVDINILERMGLEDIKDRLVDLIVKFRELEFDANEFTCLKFLILLNPGALVCCFATLIGI
jgi:hypothetical protein